MQMAQAKETMSVTPVLPQVKAIPITKAEKINLTIDHLIQRTNECGPTSLAMILKYYGKDVTNFHNWFSSDAIGHSPGELAAFAKKSGMTVRQKENGTIEELAALSKGGTPALVLGINGGGQTTTLESYLNNFADNAKHAHWMVFKGYERDENGKIFKVCLNDPNSTKDKWMSVDDFNKFWNNNLVPDGHRYFMAMAPSGTYQASALVDKYKTDQLDKYYGMANDMYDSAYALIKAGKSVEKAVAKAIDKLEHTYDEIADAMEDIGDALADAADTVSDWFSSWG